MGRIRIKSALGAVAFTVCLLLISDYVGNALIPPFNPSPQAKVEKHNWIIWPEQKNTASTSNEEKSNPQALNLEKTPSTPERSIGMLLSTASPEKGEKVARKCVACHSFKKGAKNKIGPNLYNIMGRKRATTVGYNYSKALKQIGGRWGFSDMDKFLLKPKKFLPGTKMSFKGIKNPSDRAAIIIFLRSFSENPLILPD
jgi:cytochrome c